MVGRLRVPRDAKEPAASLYAGRPVLWNCRPCLVASGVAHTVESARLISVAAGRLIAMDAPMPPFNRHSYMFNWDYVHGVPYMDLWTNMATYPMMVHLPPATQPTAHACMAHGQPADS